MDKRKKFSKIIVFFSNITRIKAREIKEGYIQNKLIIDLLLFEYTKVKIINVNYKINQTSLDIKKEKFSNLAFEKFYFKMIKLIIYILQFIYFMFLISLHQIYCVEINPEYSYIFLKIKGAGNIKVLHSGTCTHEQPHPRLPNEIYINEEKKNNIAYSYFFNNTLNNVTLIWYKPLNATGCMFGNCNNIVEIDLSYFKTSEIKILSGIFNGCSSLTSINLSNINTSQVISMCFIFYRCSSLTSIDLSNFDTSKVTEMRYMFGNCSSLTSLDLSNFDTSQANDMNYMFANCSLLTSLNLSKFDTSKVTDMKYMFTNCSSLISLDLTNFETPRLTDMKYMFANCSSLTTLDLSNFDISQVTNMNYLFDSCINLEKISLYNFYENISLNNSFMFNKIPENAVICINENITSGKIYNEITNIKCNIIDCTKNWKSKQKKLINVNNINECIESCDTSILYKYEYNGKCYDNCINGFLLDDNNNPLNKCKCELDKCLLCPDVALKNNLCTKCNVNYYPKEDDLSNIGKYINCYNESEIGYYLDKYNNLYKKCYKTCKACDIKGNEINHNCLECNNDFLFGIKINNYFNCYENCSYYYYFDKENNFHCTKNSSCPNEYPKIVESKNECIEYDIEDIINIILNNEKNITKKSKDEEIKCCDNILKKIENGFTSRNYNTSSLDNGKDKIIETEKIRITLTTTQNQRNNIFKNMTNIDLGECETLLKNYYNISDDESLYIKKLDIFQEGMKTLKVEYDVYAKLHGNNLEILNLTVCRQRKITISIPIVLPENIDIFNSSSGYYNDICYTTSSEYGTDILLKDRQKEFIDKNKIVCQEDCEFSEYNYEALIAKCSCNVKASSKSFAEMNINKEKLLENFKNIKNLINFKFLICYKKLFNKNGIIYNIGCYLLSFIILFHIITICIFLINQFSFVKNTIKNIINEIYKYPLQNEDKKEKIKKNKNNENIIFINKNLNKKVSKNKHISKKKLYKKNKLKNKNKNKKNIEENNQEFQNFIDEEINGLSYKLAIKFDKRNFCQYYISLLKTQHNLISSFLNHNDYNSGIIKIDLFLIGFAIEYTVNALFYNDDTMHKIYEIKGDFDLVSQIPIAVYSTIISMILNLPINYLALTNDAFINLKQVNEKNNIMQKSKDLKKILLIKFVSYFIIGFLFLLFFWYYISMFCVIYKNTQMHLLKDTLMSFGLSLLIPFIIYIFPGIFRVFALSNKNKKRKYLYNFSKFLQSF